MGQARNKDSLVRIQVGDRECELDFNKLTFGEVEETEMYFDKPIHEVLWESARGTMFLAYLARRRVDADFTLDDARALTNDDVEIKEEPKRPTRGKRESSGSRS